MDPTVLARIQFSLNIGFHYIFPPLSVGLGLILVIMEACYLKTKNPVYLKMTKFWVSIFALIFAIGVATGLVMVFAFGNNWANFSRFVGDVFGSILGAEGIFAFFLESGFLGVVLFGWNRVSKGFHFFATCMVTFGAHFSALWIVIANSWMQTPAGHAIVGEGEGRHAVMKDFFAVLLNPSSLDRITHVLLGCWLTGSFLVVSVSAYYLLRKRHLEMAKKAFIISITVAAVSVLLQGLSGDSSARGVAQNQPIKMAAFEGIYQTETPTSMYAFGVVDAENQTVKGLELPGMLSLLVHHNLKEPVPGLEEWPSDLWPKVPIVFQTYHGMILMWGLMCVGVVMALVAIKRKKILESKWTLRFLVISVLFPEIANELGWCSAEMGRQPWVVQGLLKTADGVSPFINATQIMISLILFSTIYLLLFILFIFLLNKKIQAGPPEEVAPVEYRDVFEKGDETWSTH